VPVVPAVVPVVPAVVPVVPAVVPVVPAVVPVVPAVVLPVVPAVVPVVPAVVPVVPLVVPVVEVPVDPVVVPPVPPVVLCCAPKRLNAKLDGKDAFVGQLFRDRVSSPIEPPAPGSLCMNRTFAPAFATTALKCSPVFSVMVPVQSLLML